MTDKENCVHADREKGISGSSSGSELDGHWTTEAQVELGEALLIADTLEDVLLGISNVIVPSGAHGATLLLSNGPLEERNLEVAAIWVPDDRPVFPMETRFLGQELFFQQLGMAGRPIVVRDVATDQRISEYMRSTLLKAGTSAFVALPLHNDAGFFGALLVDRSDSAPFNPECVHSYETAVELIRRMTARLWTIRETQQELSNTSALYEISHNLLESQNLDDILKTVLDSKLFGAAGGTIALLEPVGPASNGVGQELVFCAAAGASAADIMGLRMPVSEGVVGWVVREDEPAIVPDAYSDERFCAKIDQKIDFRTQSILCVPLRVEDRVIGAMELVDVRPAFLTEQGTRLLSRVADQAALLIYNQRLLDETRRQAHELSLLLDVSHDLTSTFEREETLHLITSRVLEFVNAHGCDVYLRQPDCEGEDTMVLVASQHGDGTPKPEASLKIGQGIAGRVAQNGVGAIANRVDLDPHGSSIASMRRGPESRLCVPLISEGRTLGIMTVTRFAEEGFGSNDLNVVSAVASQAASALEKVRLFREAQQRGQELAALNAVVSTASRSLSLEEMLGATLTQLAELLAGSAGLVCLIDASTGSLEVAAQRGLPDSLLERFERDGMQESFFSATAQEGQIRFLPNLSTFGFSDENPLGQDVAALLEAGLNGHLGTPLVAQGQILGTLGVFSTEPGTFSIADKNFLTAVGQQVGIAVRNAQLYEQTQRALRDSTALYEGSQAIANTLDMHDALETAIVYLTEHVGADQGRLLLFDDSEVSGRVVAEYLPAPEAEGAQFSIDGDLWFSILRDRGEVLLIENVHNDPILGEGSEASIQDDYQTVLLVPLMVRANLIGVAILANREYRTFTEAEVGICRALADRAALAAENCRLFSQTYDTLQETTLLYQASRALTQAQDLEDVLLAITDNLPTRNIDQCLIALTDIENENDAKPRFVEIKGVWDHQGESSLLDRHLTSQELPFIAQPEINKTWVLNDLETETAFDIQSVTTLRDLHVKSALIVPLVSSERLVGWLILATHHITHVFDPDQIRLYQALADLAAVAIRNQQLLQEVQRSLAEVEIVHRGYLRNEWMSFLTSDAERPTAVAYDRGLLLPAQDLWHPLLDKAVSEGAPATLPGIDEDASQRDNGAAEGPDQYEDQIKDLTELEKGSSLVTPLQVRGQVIGALGLLDPEQSHKWTPEELNMMQEIADRVAQAVENARLLEETQTSLAQTERLYKATGRLSNAESSEEVIGILAQEVQTALGPEFDGAVLCSGPDPADCVDWLETSARWNLKEGAIPMGTRFSTMDYPALKRLVGQQSPVVIKDAELTAGDRMMWEAVTQTRPRTISVIPLVSGNSWLGMICVTGQSKSAATLHTMRFLENLADRAAVALESARLYGETQRRAIQLEAAAKVSRAATSILEQDKLLPNIVQLIRDHFDFYHAQVFLLDPTERWAVLEASTGETGKRLLSQGYALEVGGDSLIGYVTSKGEPRNAFDITNDPVHALNRDLPDTRSELAIPIKIGGRVIGALDVHRTAPTAFNPDDVGVLSTLADQLAVAIENARLYQSQLETAQKLRDVDRLKTQFLANMSHELRTPLNSIIGFSRVILKEIDGPITNLQKQDLTAIYNSGQLLLRLINDILDISKIAAGKMELTFEEIDLREIIDAVMTTAVALVKEKPHIEFKQKVAASLPVVTADATRVRQVLLNMLSNAAKFTSEGYIELRASHDERFVTIQVSDTGIGIPSDKFDLIFQEFEQVDGTSTRAVGGTGLGLPISRRFVEMHGGTMWVESELGVGSTFSVQLPIKGPQAVEEVETAMAPSDERRVILAIDDDSAVIQLYKRFLEKRDFRVVGLSDSELALQRARALRPYAILLDVLMPGKDGWAVIRELKADLETQNTPIIMCTIVSAAGRGFSLGASDFLVKPITEERLLAALKQLEDGAHGRDGQTRSVLIIDDTPADRRFLRRVLESAHETYRVIEASGGREGVGLIQRERPDLVILDLLMPEMDGFEVLESLKSDKELRKIPIIIVTAKELTAQEQIRVNGQVAALFQKGMFKEEELLQDLNHALQRICRSEPHLKSPEEEEFA